MCPEKCSGYASSMPWEVQGRSLLGRAVLSASSPAGPRPGAPPCAPTPSARGVSGLWPRKVPVFESIGSFHLEYKFWAFFSNMRCMKKFTKKKLCPLVSSQERRAAGNKPRINRWSTVYFVSPTVYIGFPLFVLPKKCSCLFSMPWEHEGRLLPARTNPSASHPAGLAPPSRPAVRLTRPARGVSGFWIRQVQSMSGKEVKGLTHRQFLS